MKLEDDVAKQIKDVGMKDQYYKHVYLPDFARDIVLYGKTDAMGVLTSYELTPEDFQTIAKMPLFLTHVANLRKTLASSDYAVVQIKAAEALEAVVLSLQGRVAQGVMTTPELIKTGDFLFKVIGSESLRKQAVAEITGPVNQGTVVNIAYGADLHKLKPLPADVPVNETFAKVASNYDMTGVVDSEVERV